jgi:hypothetical protein
MRLTTYRNPSSKRLYAALLRVAQDPCSELFTVREDVVFRRDGAAHRNAFWAGLDGRPMAMERTSQAAVCYRAGRDARLLGLQPACSAIPVNPATGRSV